VEQAVSLRARPGGGGRRWIRRAALAGVVGNFGDGHINAFNPFSRRFLGGLVGAINAA
jgi:hypothetical protein